MTMPSLERSGCAAEPDRLIDVEPHEPLFAILAGRGYDWKAANNLDLPTQRREAGDPMPVGRIDWFFTRGLVATDPPFFRRCCRMAAQFDHEALAVTIRIA